MRVQVVWSEGLKHEFFFLERTPPPPPQAILTSGLGLLQNNKNSMFGALRPYYLLLHPLSTA